MLSNQVKGEKIEQVGEWDDHTIMAWVYERADVIYFPCQEEGQYDVDISQLLEHSLYKDIPLTLYITTKNVMDRESVFFTV